MDLDISVTRDTQVMYTDWSWCGTGQCSDQRYTGNVHRLVMVWNWSVQ